jgi:hypothetical protein
VDDPVGSRASKRILTAVRLRSCVRPCRRGVMAAGPDGVRDPVPNSPAASRAIGFNGVSGSSVRPIAISFRSFTLASTRGSSDDLKPVVPPRVIVAHADRAIPLFNHGRSLAVVLSSEDQKGRTRRSPARPPPWRCPADCPAVRLASGYIPPGGSQARQSYHSSAGSGCVDPLAGGCE